MVNRQRPPEIPQTFRGITTGRLDGLEPEFTAADEERFKAKQTELFRQHLEVAVELGLNCVIHQRDSLEDTLAQLQPFADRVRGVFHCFSEDGEVASRVVDLGFHISFSGMLTFKKNAVLREVAAQLPPERVMVETDCPYMSPEPHRSKRCEPAFVVHTAAALAAARGVAVETVARQTTENAAQLFRLPC